MYAIHDSMPRGRPRRGMGFSSVVGACFFAAQRVDGFVVPQVPTRCPRTSQSMSVESPVSRGQLLRELIPAAILGAAILGPAKPATAALPTAEDYAFGSGSKVRNVTNMLTGFERRGCPGVCTYLELHMCVPSTHGVYCTEYRVRNPFLLGRTSTSSLYGMPFKSHRIPPLL